MRHVKIRSENDVPAAQPENSPRSGYGTGSARICGIAEEIGHTLKGNER